MATTKAPAKKTVVPTAAKTRTASAKKTAAKKMTKA